MVCSTRIAMALALFLALPGLASANGCDPALFMINENTDLLTNKVVRLAFLKTMTRAQFDAARKGGSGKAKIPIKGVPIEAYGSYEQAKEAAEQEASVLQYTLDDNESVQLITNRVSEAGVSGYIACLQNQGQGIVAWVTKPSGKYIQVAVLFKPGNADHRVRPFTLDNFRLRSRLQPTFEPNVVQYLGFEKLKAQEAGYIEIAIGRYRQQLIFPAIPALKTLHAETFVSSEVASARTGLHPTPSAETCMAPPEGGWRFVPETAQAHVTKKSNDFSTAAITVKTERRICWTATARTGCRNCWVDVEARATARIEKVQ